MVSCILLQEKQNFLMFMSGSRRSPLGGLGALRMTLQRAGPDSDSLPSAHTCFHTLLLPEYDRCVCVHACVRVCASIVAAGFVRGCAREWVRMCEYV